VWEVMPPPASPLLGAGTTPRTSGGRHRGGVPPAVRNAARAVRARNRECRWWSAIPGASLGRGGSVLRVGSNCHSTRGTSLLQYPHSAGVTRRRTLLRAAGNPSERRSRPRVDGSLIADIMANGTKLRFSQNLPLGKNRVTHRQLSYREPTDYLLIQPPTAVTPTVSRLRSTRGSLVDAQQGTTGRSSAASLGTRATGYFTAGVTFGRTCTIGHDILHGILIGAPFSGVKLLDRVRGESNLTYPTGGWTRSPKRR
jgi:hypothetical protein